MKLLIVEAKWISEKQKSDYEIELIKKVDIVKDRVIFTGYVDHKELSFLFKSADLSVVPSRYNGAAPLSPIEAQMCGLEVAALANGGISEYILNKDNLTNLNGDVIEELYKRLVYYIQGNRVGKPNKFFRDRNTYYNDLTKQLDKMIK